MKQRVTISISKDVLSYVDRAVGKRGASRSEVVERLIRESQRRARDEQLSRAAKDFFAQTESHEEKQERQDWLNMSVATQKRDR